MEQCGFEQITMTVRTLSESMDEDQEGQSMEDLMPMEEEKGGWDSKWKEARVRWSMRRESLPIATIRKAFLKGKKTAAPPENLLDRRR